MTTFVDREMSTTNSVRYQIYPLQPGINLFEVCNWVLDLVKSRTNCFIWNYDAFHLDLSDDDSWLEGSMELGTDSVVCPDEWIVVDALWEATTRFPDIVARYHPSGRHWAECRCEDGDGEFLLIQSAEYIPDWLKPETAENRVPPK
jgi:SGT1 protein